MSYTTSDRPRVLLVPSPLLPVPAVQGGAVETLLTHLLRENERCGELELYCASVPDAAAQAAAAGWQHNHMLYLPVPPGHRRWLPLNAVQRLLGVENPPWEPWYQALLLTLMRQKLNPDLVFAEGGNLLQLSAISRHFGRGRTLAHLHGETQASPAVDAVYGGVAAISDFVRGRYLEDSALLPQNAYVLRNCIDTARFCPAPRDNALRVRLGFAESDFVLIFCGRLQPEKGIAAAARPRCQAADRRQPVFCQNRRQPLFTGAAEPSGRAGRPGQIYRVYPQRRAARLLPHCGSGVRSQRLAGTRRACSCGGYGVRLAAAGDPQRRYAGIYPRCIALFCADFPQPAAGSCGGHHHPAR